MSNENHHHILANDHIGRLLIKLSLPAMTGMAVTALYNIVDTIFVGRVIGPLAIAGITIVFPLQMIVMAIAMMVGIGGASVISRALGARNYQRADQTLANVITIVGLLGIVFAIAGNLLIKPILYAFGTSGTIYPFARDYARIIMGGTIFFSFAMAMNNLVRSEGRATIAMTTMLISAILNIILDALFILVFHWGIKGAAWATVISQATTDIYLLRYLFSGSSSLHFKWSNCRLQRQLVREILAIGSSAFIRQVSGSLMAVIANHYLRHYGGDLAIATYGIIHRVTAFFFMPLFGISQGAQPIIGYNYGAHRYDKTRRALQLSNGAVTVITFVAFVILMLFPRPIIRIFTAEKELIDWGVHSIRIFIILVPTLGFQVMGGTFLQALGMARKAFYLTIAKQIVMIPLMAILPLFFGLDGIWLTFPATDLIFFFVTLAVYLPIVRHLEDAHHQQVSNMPQPEMLP